MLAADTTGTKATGHSARLRPWISSRMRVTRSILGLKLVTDSEDCVEIIRGCASRALVRNHNDKIWNQVTVKMTLTKHVAMLAATRHNSAAESGY